MEPDNPLAYVLGNCVPERLWDALGLGPRKRICEMTITIKMDEAVKIKVKEIIARAGYHVMEAEREEAVTRGQLDALASELEALAARGWRMAESGKSVESTLVLDGPADRLARAVLAGDIKSALVLADLVQEVWGRR